MGPGPPERSVDGASGTGHDAGVGTESAAAELNRTDVRRYLPDRATD
ncbi:hypothetical protein GCM10027436_61520 [Actinophytocola sediminis]